MVDELVETVNVVVLEVEVLDEVLPAVVVGPVGQIRAQTGPATAPAKSTATTARTAQSGAALSQAGSVHVSGPPKLVCSAARV